MTRLPALNTHSPQKWAAVVSGTVWKRWGLSPSGTLEAETVRGPLIVWASPKPGEKEDAPALEAPKPTPLDVRVWAVNTAAHFEKFRKAARGRVRASVRWKTRRQKRRACVLEVLEEVEHAARVAARKAEGKRGLVGRRIVSAREHREALRDAETERIEKGLSRLVFSQDAPYGSWESVPRHTLKLPNGKTVTYWEEGLAAELDMMKLFPDPEMWHGDKALPELLAFARLTGDRRGLREVLAALTFGRVLTAYELAHALRFLEAAAYLAHARRKVRPARRADRVPRPVHTRPRPPSAPLAPPVA